MKKPIILTIIATLILAVVLILPHVSRVGAPAHFLAAASDARQAVFGLQFHSEKHGNFPKQLNEILKLANAISADEVLYNRETYTENAYQWHYYGRFYQGQPLAEYMMLAAPMLYDGETFSPMHQDGQRLVAYADGHTGSMDKAEFQAAIKRQLEQK